MLAEKEKALGVSRLFSETYLVGVGEGARLFVFEQKLQSYRYRAVVTLPIVIPRGTRAAFPIEALGDMCCIITPECLDDPPSYIAVLHEMVHCFQGRHFEDALKRKLTIHRKAVETQNWMWEIQHPFPYGDSEYRMMLKGLDSRELAEIVDRLASLQSRLEREDFEYMVWQIWKEGFARYIENGIRRLNGVAENIEGSDWESPNRTSLYHLGDVFWRRVAERRPELVTQIDRAFLLMLDDQRGLLSA